MMQYNELISQVESETRPVTRTTDTICRYGYGEFIGTYLLLASQLKRLLVNISEII